MEVLNFSTLPEKSGKHVEQARDIPLRPRFRTRFSFRNRGLREFEAQNKVTEIEFRSRNGVWGVWKLPNLIL